MYEGLLKKVTNLGSPRIFVVGDYMLDIYSYGDATRISPEAPVPVLKISNTEYACGGAGAVAADLGALGAVPMCLGVIGQDNNGQSVREMLTESGADVTGLVSVSGRPTTTKQRLIGVAQHRHRQQLFRLDEEYTEPLSEKTCTQLLDLYRQSIKHADVICIQDYNKGLLSPKLCEEMIKLADEAGKTVLVDPPLISDYCKYAGASLIMPNRQEASLVAGYEINTAEDAARAAENLAEKVRLDAVAITLDKEGIYLRTRDYRQLVPTRPRSVYDVTGAGDIVLAMFAAALAANCDYKTAAELANIAGGIEVEKFGATTVGIEEIINDIVGQSRGKHGKVHSLDSLMGQLHWHRSRREKIVFTNGCFDVVHRGHIEYINFCKRQGGVLVIGLNSDNSVRQIKGPERPINNQYDRAAVLAALEAVDYVIIFEESKPINLIKQIKPDILVKGEDWAVKGVVGREIVESYGGKVMLAPLVKGKSSTSTIEKIRNCGKNSQ